MNQLFLKTHTHTHTQKKNCINISFGSLVVSMENKTLTKGCALHELFFNYYTPSNAIISVTSLKIMSATSTHFTFGITLSPFIFQLEFTVIFMEMYGKVIH